MPPVWDPRPQEPHFPAASWPEEGTRSSSNPPRICPPFLPRPHLRPSGHGQPTSPRQLHARFPRRYRETTLPASSPSCVVRRLPTGQTQTWYTLSLSLARMQSRTPMPGRKGKVQQVSARYLKGGPILLSIALRHSGGGGGETWDALYCLFLASFLSTSPAGERKKETHSLPWLISSKSTAREGSVTSPGRGAASGYQRDAYTYALLPNTPQLTSCTPRRHSMTSASRPPLRSRRRSLPLPSASHDARPKSGTRHHPVTAG